MGGVLWDVRCGVRICLELFIGVFRHGDVEFPVVVIPI